jgi:hypothetical protein
LRAKEYRFFLDTTGNIFKKIETCSFDLFIQNCMETGAKTYSPLLSKLQEH